MLIYYVTYTELHSFEIAQLLNNNCIIQFSNHYNQQQIQQQVQLSVEDYNDNIQQQTFGTMSIRVYSDNNENMNAENMQDGGDQQTQNDYY
jgi:hypothetical protein